MMKTYLPALAIILFLLSACQAGTPTPMPTSSIPSTPINEYHFGSGGSISIEKLLEMESQDPTIVKQIGWLNTWGDWYGSADPSIRPMTSGEARTDIVFYEWTGSDGSIHYKAAWKFDAGYPGYVLVPPAINWKDLNPPVAAPAGHEIGPGQGPVMISIECLEGSDLAKMGVPVGARLSPEAGTGDWVMVFSDKVVARIDASGVWRLESPPPTETPAPAPVEFPVKYPVEVSHSYSAEVGGMEIPVSIGITKQIMTRPSEPITDIQIAPDTVPLVGDYFLHMCYYRYTEVQGNAGVNYEDYLKLVAEGKGEVQIAAFDGADPNGGIQIMTVHPEKGVSFVFLDGPTLPITLGKYGEEVYFGVSGGKFQLVQSLPSYKITSWISQAYENEREYGLSEIIAIRLQELTLLADGKNECIEALDYNRGCGTYRPPATVNAYIDPLVKNLLYHRYGRTGQAFIVKQK